MGILLAQARMGILIHIDEIPSQRRIVRMLAVRITGNQLRAARVLVGLSREEVAGRARCEAGLPPCLG